MTDSKTISYQGEPGANSHIICAEAYPDWTPLPCPTFEDAFAAVTEGRAQAAMIPIENSIEGSIPVTLDTLAFDTDLLVQREVDLPVSLNLCARPGTSLRDITTVVSHPNPLGQTRVWLAKNLPDAR